MRRVFHDDGMSSCGCKSCGGTEAARSAVLARRVIRRIGYVRTIRPDARRDRQIPADDFSRALLQTAVDNAAAARVE